MNNQNMNNTNELRVAFKNESDPEIETMKAEEIKINPLPIGYFPRALQEIIEACAETYGTPRDYWSGAVLAATSLAIGNKLELVTKYRNAPVFWQHIGSSANQHITPFTCYITNPCSDLNDSELNCFMM